MRIGIFAGSDGVTVDELIARASRAAAEGFDTIWYPQVMSIDALSALVAIAREVPDIDLGTAVVPIQGRHPIPLALQALTVADVAGPGRFTLGIGVTHKPVSEGWFGISYKGIVDVCTEVVEAINDLMGPERSVDFTGEHVHARLTTPMPAPTPGLMLAALGPRMLDLAGSHTDGTITWMTGPRSLGRDVTPRITASAEAAGRPDPRIVVGIPVCVTDDVDDARSRLATMMTRNSSMPSYRHKVEAEGIDSPVDLVVLGDEAAVSEQLDALAASGMTELCANVVGTDEEQERTRSHLIAISS